MDDKPALALWNAEAVDSTDWLLLEKGKLVIENRWLQRKTLSPTNGRIRLLLRPEPVTLIGLHGKLKLDKSCLVEISAWNTPGKNVPVKVTLSNPLKRNRTFSLQPVPPEGWKVSISKLQGTLAPGAEKQIALEMVPPPGLRRGAFRFSLSGRIDTAEFNQSKGFSVGSHQVIHQTGERSLKADGDLSNWKLSETVPNGLADRREQVFALKKGEKWGGLSDLSAKLWMRWERHNNLFLAIEVTDDRLVTRVDGRKATESDSVEFFMDVRPGWMHFRDDYSKGAFHLVFVPAGENGRKEEVRHVGTPFARIYGLGSRRTPTGYTIEVSIHFRSGNMADTKDPWVAGRKVRVGMLVNDADDPKATARKLQMGVWRTMPGASSSCDSWTPFVLRK